MRLDSAVPWTGGKASGQLWQPEACGLGLLCAGPFERERLRGLDEFDLEPTGVALGQRKTTQVGQNGQNQVGWGTGG